VSSESWRSGIAVPAEPASEVHSGVQGARLALTVRLREIGTGISESKQRVPIFLRDVRGGKQVPILDRNSDIHSQDHRGTGTNPWAWPGSDPAATIVASSQS
jgi:hypothetical protein